MTHDISIFIPTYNAGDDWRLTLDSISRQNFNISKKAIIDSRSKDRTVELAQKYGFDIVFIEPSEFDHGLARQKLIDLFPETSIYVFLTQDAIFTDDNSIEKIIQVFDNESIGMAYGRQLPHINSKTLEAHARLFNYPDSSQIKGKTDIPQYGFKTIFCSDSFAAYRSTAFKDVGGFPIGSIMGEDTIVAAKMIKNGWKVAYVADARVYHSHSYTLSQEFKRYFDTRIFHEQNNWLIKEFGKPVGEGLKFVKSEIRYTLKYDKSRLFKSFGSILAKWLGYNLAKFYKIMPDTLLRKLSMHKFYWNRSQKQKE